MRQDGEHREELRQDMKAITNENRGKLFFFSDSDQLNNSDEFFLRKKKSPAQRAHSVFPMLNNGGFCFTFNWNANKLDKSHKMR